MSEPDINGAFETVARGRARLAKSIDALCKQAVMENEIGQMDVIAVLEDCKLRRWASWQDVARTTDTKDDGENWKQGSAP